MGNNTNEQLKEIVDNYGEDLEKIVEAIGNRIRMIIIASLIQKPKEFSELQEITKLSKTALAHHLEKLVNSTIIKNVSRGKYEITKDGHDLLNAIITAYITTIRKKEIEAKKKADQIQKMYSQMKEDGKELKVQFVRLLPMRVVSFQAYGKSPENDAMSKLRAWAEPKSIFSDLEEHPIFGFNNPSPTPGKKEYGYEFWIQVEPTFNSTDVIIKNIPEGFYAVTRCVVNDPYIDIPNAWKNLRKWINDKGYELTGECGFEKVASSSSFILDIYIPIKEESVTKKL